MGLDISLGAAQIGKIQYYSKYSINNNVKGLKKCESQSPPHNFLIGFF